MGDLGIGTGDPFAGLWAVAFAGTLSGELAEPRHFVVTVGTRVGRQIWGDELEIERARSSNLHRCVEHTRIPFEATLLFEACSDVSRRRSGQPAVMFLERTPMPHRGKRCGELSIARNRIADIVCCDHGQVAFEAKPGERIVAGGTDRGCVVPDFDGEVVATETFDEFVEFSLCRDGAVCFEGLVQRPFLRTSQHHPLVASELGQPVEVVAGSRLLSRHLTFADRPPQPGIAVGPTGQDDEVAGSADLAEGVGGVGEAELSTKHSRQAMRPGGLGETDNAVEPISVGERECVEACTNGFFDEDLGVGCSIEEAEVRVTMELGIGSCYLPGRLLNIGTSLRGCFVSFAL